MSKILFISVIRSDFSKLLSLALFLRSNGVEVEFYFDQRWHNLTQSIEESTRNNFTSYYTPSSRSKVVRSENTRPTQTHWLIRPIVFLKRVFSEIHACKKIQSNFKKILSQGMFGAVIVPVNSFGYNIPVFLSVCRKRKLPTICIPFAVGDKDAAEKAIIFAKKSSPEYLGNRFVAALFPKWVVKTNGKKYLVLPAETVLAFRFLGIIVDFPLSFYGTEVTCLFLENEYMMKHAEKQQVAALSVEITGTIFDDDLVAAKATRLEKYERLCEELAWDPKKKLVCIALPPFVRESESDDRFFDFDDLIKIFLPFELPNWNIIISLHPRTVKEKIEPNYKHICWWVAPVELAIPICDLFISTFSSTIRTAVALDIPVINYDVLQFNYSLYKDLPGIIHVNTAKEYNQLIGRLIKEDDFAELKDKSVYNPLRSTMDGRSKNRILTKIQQIIEG